MHKLLLLMMLITSQLAMAQLPQVYLKDIDGRRIDTSKLDNDGRPFIISFFASWCKPCLRELNSINSQYGEWQRLTGCRLVAVSIDRAQDVAKVKPLVSAQEWKFEQVLLDPNSVFLRKLGFQMVPSMVIVAPDGTIVDRRNGYVDGEESSILDKLKEILAE